MRTTGWMVLALFSGLCGSAFGQAAAALPAGAPQSIAVIAFETAVTATNEFQRDFAEVEKKFDPQRTQLKSLTDEIETLTKQLQTQGAMLSDSEQASRARTIEDKKKQAQRLAEDAQTGYQDATQEVFNRVAGKVAPLVEAYAKEHGIALVIDNANNQQQSPVVLYWNPGIDITKAIVDAYNAKSGVAAPATPAPSAPQPAPRPSAKPPASQ